MEAADQSDLALTALDHLWLHFTEMGGYSEPADLQVIVKGDGCYGRAAAQALLRAPSGPAA